MVINHENKILLVESYSRGWEFPGGYVQKGESIKGAAIREVKEESGIDIRITKFLGVEHNIKRSTIVVVLKGESVGGKLAISDENQDVGFFNFEQSLGKIKRKNFKDRLLMCFDKKVIPFFIDT